MRDSRARRPAVRKIRLALSKLAASDTVAVGAAAAVAATGLIPERKVSHRHAHGLASPSSGNRKWESEWW